MTITKEWVQALSIRYQGTLMTVIRGCDGLPKEDQSKPLVRVLRGLILNTVQNPEPFIEYVDTGELVKRFNNFSTSIDHYPLHWFMHFLHCIEIIGFKHPDKLTRSLWFSFYLQLVHKLHLNIEREDEMDYRLNKD